ncbi:MAG: PBP1A family penicillin-binding protein [Atopobiaceae bacterium]|nr:PBP1A family penicillin-binding protein [Atopobiaceae bacterium]
MGIRTRRAHKHSRTHIIGFGIAGFFAFMALLMIALAVSVTSLVDNWLQDLPDYTSADSYLAAEPTEVYDINGERITTFFLQNRRSVDADQISPYVLKATVDTEDIRFYQHSGIDSQGIIRAVWSQLIGRSEGASTITQQLVRNTILSGEQFEQSLKRKVREAFIAVQMEKTYSKDQILLMYLNTIYFGHSAYGIEAASVTYFNKSAAELTLAEAATLVGIPNSPSYYDPTVNMEACKQRRDLVLDRMYTAGDITKEEYDQAISEEIVLNLGSSVVSSGSTFPYFTDYVRTLLEEDFDTKTIFQGGLKVYTTIDPEWQEMAEESVHWLVDSTEQLECALVAVEVDTGYIRAMVGGRDYNLDQFNLATQARRQPGSSFKTFTLAAAIQSGVNPQTLLNCNSPQQITSTWRVQNISNVNYGTITLARATELSSNTGYARVAQGIGPDTIVQVAHAMGVSVDLPSYSSITLGTIGVPPVQMAEGYATLASGGIHRDAIAITRILDRNDNIVYEHTDSSSQALDPAVAWATTRVLEGVVNVGDATGAVVNQNRAFDQPVAGKTGTSEEYRDLWFCGYTPQVAVSVWTGYRTESTVYIGGDVGHPSDTSCLVFTRFTNQLLGGMEREEFPTADEPEYKAASEWPFAQGSAGGSSSSYQGYQGNYTYQGNYNGAAAASNDDNEGTSGAAAAGATGSANAAANQAAEEPEYEETEEPEEGGYEEGEGEAEEEE